MDLVVRCYQLTSQFPKTEIYELSSQIQRAAFSIPAKIAEEKGRNYLVIISVIFQLLMVHYLMIVGRLGYIKQEELKILLNKCEEIG